MNDHPAAAQDTVRQVAVIDMGTTSIRMAVAEISRHRAVKTLETLQQAVNLGRDTFTDGVISKKTIEECVAVLAKYRQKLDELGITDPQQIRVVATSAVREARNRLAFVDRIFVATGIEIHIADEAEVSRITYLGVHPFLKKEPLPGTGKTIVIEVGGGSTEVLVLKGTDVIHSQTHRLGSLRLRKKLEAYHAPMSKAREIMESHIRHTISQMREDVVDRRVELIALGGDMRFATRELIPTWEVNTAAELETSFLEEFTDHILSMSRDEIARKYHLSFPDAETVGPALLSYVLLAQAFELTHVKVTNTNLRDGLLQELAAKDVWIDELRTQIVRSAIDLGRRYDFDEQHACHVAELSSSLFWQLRSEHQLDPAYELLLHVAALLHEIGGYISNRSLHKHSMYLIRHSELFGLGQRQLLLVALIARYHRRASPQQQHDAYSNLPRPDRVAVAKLAAILRIAIAIDDSRSQWIKQVDCKLVEGRLVLNIHHTEDISIEQIAVRQHASLFEEIYGKRVELRQARP